MEQGNKPAPGRRPRSDATTPSTHEQHAESVRFVVLRHRQHEGSHFDLMIENGPTLATWTLDAPPATAEAEGLPCTRIAEHRRQYLTYEGPVSADRGDVAQHDSGTCRVLERSDTSWRLAFDGRRLTGIFHLEKTDAQGAAWRLRPLSP